MKLHFVVAGFSKMGQPPFAPCLWRIRIFYSPGQKEPRFSAGKIILVLELVSKFFMLHLPDALLGEGSVSYTEYEFAPCQC